MEMVSEEQRHTQVGHLKRVSVMIEAKQRQNKFGKQLNVTMMQMLANPMEVAEYTARLAWQRWHEKWA